MSQLASLGMPQDVIANDVTIPIFHTNIPHQMDEDFIEESNHWENKEFKEHEMRAAKGYTSSKFFMPLKSHKKKYDKLLKEVIELEGRVRKNFGKDMVLANVEVAFSNIKRLKNLLQNVCGRSKSNIRNGLHRNKRFISILLFFIFTTIAVAGISTAVGRSSRLVTKEDIQSANETSIEKLQLNRAEIKRLEKNSKEIDELEGRFYTVELKAATNKYAKTLEQNAETEFRELESILNPERVRFEDSFFMEHMAHDIRNYFAATNNDLFEHVLGTGVSEVFYFTSFKTIVLQDEFSDSCDNGYVMIVANTFNPIMDIVGTKTKEPQTYETKDGRYFYVKQDFIIPGSPFRPMDTLSSQRLIITTRKISVTVLNNTVFMIYNNELKLDIHILCPGKNVTQETLYKNPFLRLHTSCELFSEHLNISTFTEDHQKEDFADTIKFENIEEEFDFEIGYHRQVIDDKHDIEEMYNKANDIFIKESEVLQHEMKKLEEDESIGKILEEAGSAVTGWFNESLHVIVGAIAYGAVFISIILILVIAIKCCSCCAKEQSCETLVEDHKPNVQTNQEDEKTSIVMTDK